MGRFCTDFLFARPSFLSGAARALDLFGLLDSYNESKNGKEADAKALYSDWAMVGQDVWDSAFQFKGEAEADAGQLKLHFSE